MTALTGTWPMARLILRRDRFLMPVWVLFLGAMPANFAAATEPLYPTAAEQALYARTTAINPTFLALYGPIHDDGLGGIVAQRAGFIPVIVGLLCALTVIRHTRTEEEAGRRELLGATVLGRGAGLAAALLVTMTATVVLAAITVAGMTAQGLPLAGSLALGLQFALAGWVFSAVAGIAAQLSTGAGSARGIAISVLGGAFVVRMAADVGGSGGITDVYFAAIMGMVGLFAAGYAVSAALRARAEESTLRAEPILATRVGRLRWLSSHVLFVLAGSAAGLAFCGFFTGLTHGLAQGNLGHELPRLLGAAMVQLPAVWLIAAVALAFVGLLPRFAAAGGWGVLAVAAVVTLFGSALRADQWLLDVSPFSHIPKLPGHDLTFTPLVWLSAMLLALGAVGLVAFRRRDMVTT